MSEGIDLRDIISWKKFKDCVCIDTKMSSFVDEKDVSFVDEKGTSKMSALLMRKEHPRCQLC
jgi:hypothetical protein